MLTWQVPKCFSGSAQPLGAGSDWQTAAVTADALLSNLVDTRSHWYNALRKKRHDPTAFAIWTQVEEDSKPELPTLVARCDSSVQTEDIYSPPVRHFDLQHQKIFYLLTIRLVSEAPGEYLATITNALPCYFTSVFSKQMM
eukprot:GHVT01044075.1.p2 GENE.GHVT01044075.1~~GHVT01044075.1.p2  ORF type:complete len:141 (+),score=7.75 GHVT01044075.1:1541-1963(+)